MMGRFGEAGLLLGVLVLTGVASWWLILRPVVDPDPRAFDGLPTTLIGWESFDFELEASVSEMLGADHNVQRVYRHPLGYQVFVYIGYYGTRRGGTPEHTPDVCYPAQGWEIRESEQRRVGGGAGFDLQEFVVEKDGERRLVHFWYRTSAVSGITSVTGLRLNHFWSRITENRGDGALVRLSTQVQDGDVQAARTRLYSMDTVLESEIAELWPQRALEGQGSSS